VTILGGPVRAAAVGIDLFADELERQGVVVDSLAWAPPAEGADALRGLVPLTAWVAAGNEEAVHRLREARPLLIGIARAGDVIPDMDERTFLHAGPPIGWDEMTGPMRGAAMGAALFEGLADTADEAAARLEAGAVRFSPNHEHASVAPMAGIVSPSMPVWIVEVEPTGNRSFSPVNEGMGRVLRFGAYHREHVDHLAWLRDRMLPVLRSALELRQAPIDVRSLIAQALQMGDECHNRHKAGSALFLREIAPALVATAHPSSDLAAVVADLAANEISFLNPTMAAAKAVMDAASGVPGSSVVTAMTRNGREFGIRVSGLPDRWFTGPASRIDGLYFPGYGPEDANPDLGDSAITETMGLGGFAVAASQAVLQTVGGTIEESLRITRSMYQITWDEHPTFQVPALGFRGTPLGIDAREVVHTGILPVINTGIAHREPGIGQIGAGVVRPPAEPFVHALVALSDAARAAAPVGRSAPGGPP
jgi:uncharacterized protein DUF1116